MQPKLRPLLLSLMIAIPSSSHALVYEVEAEDGWLGRAADGSRDSNAPYSGPLNPGDSYDGNNAGFVWPRHDPDTDETRWERLDVLESQGMPSSELAIGGDTRAAYVALDPKFDQAIADDHASVLISGWRWSQCCAGGDGEALADVLGGDVTVTLASYSGLSPWYLIAGDVVAPAQMTFSQKLAQRDGASRDIPLPSLPALMAGGLLAGLAPRLWRARRQSAG